MVDAEPSNVFYRPLEKRIHDSGYGKFSEQGYFQMLSKSYQTGHSVSTKK